MGSGYFIAFYITSQIGLLIWQEVSKLNSIAS